MKKHLIVIAWYEWKKRSPESFVSATLSQDVRKKADSNLENRLRHAFSAGAEAAIARLSVETGSGRG